MPSNPKHQAAFERACADARCTHQNALAEAQAEFDRALREAEATHPKSADWLEEARHRHALAVRFADAVLNEKFAEARRRLLNADG
jgi:hypothetical protein